MSPIHAYRKSVIYVIISMFFLASSYLLFKLSWKAFPYFFFIFLIFAFPLVVVSVEMAIKRKFRECFYRKYLPIHLLRALFAVGYLYSLFYYLSENDLLNASVLLSLTPLLIPVITWFVRKQPMTKLGIITLIIAFIGVIFVLHPGSGLFSHLSYVGFLAAIFSACSQVVFGAHVKKQPVDINVFQYFVFGTGITLILLLVSYFGFGFEKAKYAALCTSEKLFPWLLIFLLTGALIGNQWFRGLAYRSVEQPAILAPFLLLAVLFSAIYDWVIFHNIPGLFTTIGTILVVGSSLMKIYFYQRLLKKNHRL